MKDAHHKTTQGRPAKKLNQALLLLQHNATSSGQALQYMSAHTPGRLLWNVNAIFLLFTSRLCLSMKDGINGIKLSKAVNSGLLSIINQVLTADKPLNTIICYSN